MNMDMKTSSALQLSSSALRIDGQAEIILCASLFYFRNPRAHWRERLEQVKAFGYNAIDVYFPWNFHELEEGSWDFSGERDVEAFLQMAADVGLWVVARPGPYICSEWDGGALPAYLFAKPDMVIRSTDSTYLQAVEKWFDRILPLMAKYEQQRGGSIICVQLENELDFYDCPDPKGYITALRDMAVNRGIQVPLIACAGQGGLYEASGLVEDVAPTCNFYPNDKDPEFEYKVTAYEQRLAEHDLPLLVTETNRSHFLLRRLLSCGAKLLGPYLQVSGTNFGFTNGTNNWGDPLALMTSDYDFYGMISPEGHIRPEAYEGRLMRRIITAYGSSLAEAQSAPAADIATARRLVVDSADATAPGTLVQRQLQLAQGGHLLFVANVGEQEEVVQLELQGTGGGVIPQTSKLRTIPARCEMLPIGVPMSGWGIEGVLRYSTAELTDVHREAAKTVIVFHSEYEGEIALNLKQPAVRIAENGVAASANGEDGNYLFVFQGKAGTIASCTLELADGTVLELVCLARADALLMNVIQDGGEVTIGSPIAYDDAPRETLVDWSLKAVSPTASLSINAAVSLPAADFLENNGIYRGYAWYEADSGIDTEEQAVQGILVQNGSDMISLYAGDSYLGTMTPGGGSRFIRGGVGNKLTARVEIWGHTNFDDPRLPALRLDSMKGLTGLVSVTGVKPLLHWRILRVKSRTLQPEVLERDYDDQAWAICTFGGWLSPDHPSSEYYRKTFTASENADSWTLHFKGIQALAQVFVNGASIGTVHPFDPYLNISKHVQPGEEVQVTVFLERVLGLGAGEVIVYEGNAARNWQLSAADEAGLLAHAEAEQQGAVPTSLPVSMEAGSVSWLYGTLPEASGSNGWRVYVKGSGMKATIYFGGVIVGRLWTAGGDSRPAMSGGGQDSFFLPGPWFAEGENKLIILLEAVEAGSTSRLESLTFVPAGVQL
ncbi:beta-galactosidase [Paenibacillus sp. CF384]|uniref:beta-galactosidase n=1 Tax=Paenibacillus sp. CF384 TaxID=1884382 RepID=UPI00089D9A7E|nr:beta-galactosidase [Paenibacillus sp. CF384]SDX74600.1 beta-galactosidase [Paenibacillus sp. CF384]